jgi:putative nucleotidyltransferase with HDIG domain
MATKPTPTSAHVTPERLCVGMYVQLDLPWTDHPFTFSSFKIKSLDQIETLQSLGLLTIQYNPSKSDSEPLQPSAEPVPIQPAPKSHDGDPLYMAKQERVQRLMAQQARVAAGERELLTSARAIKSINQNVFANPEQAREDAQTLVQGISDSMMTDADIAINLMKDQIGGEDVYFHSLNVTLLSMMLAKELKAPANVIRLLGLGAIFHDVGKADIPDRIVRKAEALTKPELSLLQQHCAYGVDTGRKMGLPNEALMVIAQHHEFMDGSGYPKGIKGTDCYLLARIVAIANTYDNLCNPIKQSLALTPHQAVSLMYAQQRAKFDPSPLTTFVRCMGIYPPGTIVVLSNDSIGMVVSVNSSLPLKPTVLIYDRFVPRERGILVELERETDVTISRAIKPDLLPKPVYDYLAPQRRMTYYFDSESRNAAKQ